MVIDKGHQVFFGSIDEARPYFEGLGFKQRPRQTTPDYLTGCTDPFERGYREGYSEISAPHDSESLEKAFNESSIARWLSKEMATYRQELQTKNEVHEEFEVANREAKRRHTSQSSVYGAPFHIQVGALMQRQFLIKWQNKFSLCVSWTTSITIAIVLGTGR
jgi:ABC-type multidrug transport system ATPase subunit